MPATTVKKLPHSTTIKKLPNYDLIRKFQAKRIKQINDFFIEVNLTISALGAFKKLVSDSPRIRSYTVPKTTIGTKNVYRNKEEIIQYIDRRINYSEYAQSLVFAVAIAEDYLQDIMFFVLIAFPKKLLISAKGNEGDRSISLKDIIDKENIEDIVVDQALLRIHEVMHASPSQYSMYFEKVVGFNLGENVARYVEIKATRDLLIHNDGLINEIYIAKAGKFARGDINERISVDSQYFEESVRNLKNISSTIYRGLMDKYGDSAPFAKAVSSYII